MAKLKEKYQKEVIPKMREKFGYQSPMAVPRMEKVVVNTSFGRLISGKSPEEQKKITDGILQDFSALCGQHAILTKARKSISGFKIRKGMPLGAKVTLRGKRMYDFLERLIHIVLPGTRDFRGIDSASLDQQGNLTLGIKEHIFFPEISAERARNIFGLEITMNTTAQTKEEGKELLKLLGFPLKKENGYHGPN